MPMIDSSKIRLVYILSASHSGSTLLAMLLGSHPEICTVGELKVTSLGDKERYLCSCRTKINECQFWTGISRDMAQRGISFDITAAGTDIRSGLGTYARKLLQPLHRGHLLELIRDIALNLSPTWRRQLPIIQSVNANLMDCILARTGKKIIVDSSKIGIRLKYLLRNPSLDVKIIRLIRDGREVALSYIDPMQFADTTDPRFRGGGMGGGKELGRPMAEAAYEWRRSNEEAEAILQRIVPTRWIETRYESLCTDPNNTLHQLFAFMGVSHSESITDFRSVDHHIVGNGMRLDSTSEIRFDKRWETILTASDLKIFDSVAGEMSHKLGYL